MQHRIRSRMITELISACPYKNIGSEVEQKGYALLTAGRLSAGRQAYLRAAHRQAYLRAGRKIHLCRA